MKSLLIKGLPVVVILIVVVSLGAGLVMSCANLDYFKLKAIETEGAQALASFKATAEELLKTYRGKSIFAPDIAAIAMSVQARYPDVKDVRVRRKLPDRLSLSVTMRMPIALLGEEKYYPVDRDGFILPNANASQWQKLPIITGVDIKESDKVGKRCESRALRVALELIAEMDRSKILSEYTVTTIDVSDSKNVSLFLEDGLEVKVGHENFKERLEKLAQTLKNPKLIVSRVKYIDLRFKDIVIGQK
jgi:cell division septal protein FtsQ